MYSLVFGSDLQQFKLKDAVSVPHPPTPPSRSLLITCADISSGEFVFCNVPRIPPQSRGSGKTQTDSRIPADRPGCKWSLCFKVHYSLIACVENFMFL